MTGLGFPQMEHVLPAGRHGLAEVRHQPLSEVMCALLAAQRGWRSWDRGGVNVALVIHGADEEVAMMSDMRFERESCAEVLQRAHGRVLIAGLGLGMILHPLCVDSRIERITVVEKLQDVIDLVGPSVAGYRNLQVVHADIFSWLPDPAARFDTIWFDIWPGWGAANLPEIFALYQRYRQYLAPGGWMDAWMRRESCRKLRHQSPELHRGRRHIAHALHRLGIAVPKGARITLGTVSEEVSS